VTAPRPVEVEARLLRALGAAGGAVPLPAAAGDAPPDTLEAALERLVRDGLAELGGDGVLRPGPRGSLLSEDRVREALRTERTGQALEIHACVGSTNDLVMRRAGDGAPPGLVVAAELQTGGRGRRGRTFDSRPGLGVWSTTLLPAPRDPAAAPRLSLVAALAVAETVEELTAARAGIKWPNDVRIDGRKVCGVLVEARAVGRELHVVAGIGLNVHHRDGDFPPELRGTAASLESATGATLSRSRVLAALLFRLESLVDEERAGVLDLPERFAARDDLQGRAVRLDAPGGERRGTARGIDAHGRLRLETDDGIVPVSSAEATLAPA
jgi:BirA family transcriptional regulator, biotin operon repressor / biotin---[acetyl-CoA-carboxylase] ligase